jgi:hypothetical protein
MSATDTAPQKPSCGIFPLRPANPTPLEAAIFAASDAWFLADRARDAAEYAAKSRQKSLAERDEHRRECGRQLALAKRLHAEAKINIPWKDWAPTQTGWSYPTIARRMKDFVEPDDAPKRRERQRSRDKKVSRNQDRETSPAPAAAPIDGAKPVWDNAPAMPAPAAPPPAPSPTVSPLYGVTSLSRKGVTEAGELLKRAQALLRNAKEAEKATTDRMYAAAPSHVILQHVDKHEQAAALIDEVLIYADRAVETFAYMFETPPDADPVEAPIAAALPKITREMVAEIDREIAGMPAPPIAAVTEEEIVCERPKGCGYTDCRKEGRCLYAAPKTVVVNPVYSDAILAEQERQQDIETTICQREDRRCSWRGPGGCAGVGRCREARPGLVGPEAAPPGTVVH